MPRPKVNPDELLKLEVRITPPDGQPITDWKIGDDFNQLIAAQEGGTDECRLHYHLYIETLRSRSWITKWIYSIAHCYNGEQGNAVFFTRKPHDNTIGYVVKHGHVVVSHGCTQTFITEWLERSNQYKLDKDSARQRAKRMKQSFTQAVIKKVAEHIAETRNASERNPESLMRMIMMEYHESKLTFPSRTVLENMILTLMYPYDEQMVRAFYLRNFEPR